MTQTWVKSIGLVDIGERYSDFSDVIDGMLKEAGQDLLEKDGRLDDPTVVAEMKEIIEGLKMTDLKATRHDTSLTGCPVFNPYPQACRFDDPVFPINATDDKDFFERDGYGAVYAMSIAEKQKILYLSFGTPVFCGLTNFFSSSTEDTIMANVVKNGRLSIAGAAGAVVGALPGMLFKIALWPITVSSAIGDVLGDRTTITRYFDFRESMLLYYLYVNAIMMQLSVTLGFRMGAEFINDSTAHKRYKDRLNADDDLPTVVKENADIFTIITSRYRKLEEAAGQDIMQYNTEELFEMDTGGEAVDPGETFFTKALNKFEEGFKAGIRGSNRFIGFRIEKSSSANESVSNSTGPPSIVNTLNSFSQSVKDAAFSVQDGNIFSNEGVLSRWTNNVIGALKDFSLSAGVGIADTIGAGSAVQIASGNGQFDIPDMFLDSKFTKAQHFTIRLTPTAGDIYSIYQDLYIPYALFLAGALPRAIGFNIYNSPFLCQGYVRGLFSTTLGIISDLDATRGDSELGWNMMGLPLVMDLKITIKDLSPAMFLSMQTAVGQLFNLRGSRNDAWIDYVNTLGGIGLSSRIAKMHNIIRNKSTAMLRIKESLLSPEFLGYFVGDNAGIFKTLVRASPYRDYQEK